MFNVDGVFWVSPEQQFDENFRIFRRYFGKLLKNVYAKLFDLLRKTKDVYQANFEDFVQNILILKKQLPQNAYASETSRYDTYL